MDNYGEYKESCPEFKLLQYILTVKRKGAAGGAEVVRQEKAGRSVLSL
jgi:hypothetical protein